MIEKKVLIKNINNNFKTYTKYSKKPSFQFCYIICSFSIILLINDFIFISIFKISLHKPKEIILNKNIKYSDENITKSNINFNNEFFQIKEVIEQIKKNNLKNVNTIFGGKGNIGNALLILNNLINICEEIQCKNIIVPMGLQDIIKKPIYYEKYNIKIFPYSDIDKFQLDINLSSYTAFYFRYRKRIHYMRLGLIREEVFRNLPAYNISPSDLYIHIRSGDIFINMINPNYSQPPLCFYQKIINENNFSNIFLLSNGTENPVINELLKLYPKIKFIKDSIINDITKIVNAYNLVLSRSTFISTLITLNTNVKKIYAYEICYNNFTTNNYTKIYKMKSSEAYKKLMKGRWKNTKEQLNLMLTENCTNTPFIL